MLQLKATSPSEELDLGRLEADVEKAVMQTDPAAALNDLAEQARHALQGSTEEKKQALEELKQLSKGAEPTIGHVADNMEELLSLGERKLKTTKSEVTGLMEENVGGANAAIDSVVEAVQNRIDSAGESVANALGTSENLRSDFDKIIKNTIDKEKKVVGEYVGVAKASLQARKHDVNRVLTEAALMGEETHGLAGQLLQDLKNEAAAGAPANLP